MTRREAPKTTFTHPHRLRNRWLIAGAMTAGVLGWSALEAPSGSPTLPAIQVPTSSVCPYAQYQYVQGYGAPGSWRCASPSPEPSHP